MNTFKENIINFIKTIKIKYVILSLILATIFTFFSQHLFVNSKYWSNTYLVPEMSFCRIELTSKDLKENPKSSFALVRLANSPNTNFEYFKKELSEDTDRYTILLSISPKETINYFKLKSKISANLKFKLEEYTNTGKEITYNFIKVKNKIYKPNETISFKVKQNEEVELYFSTKYKTQTEIKQENINNFAKYALFFAYFLIFYFITKNISKEKINKFIKDNKIPIGIFILFFIVYFYTIYNLGTHTNFFNRYWTFFGDNIIFLQDIIYSKTKRFHSYFFVPFYPLFEFLFFCTKNYMLSIFTIIITLTSASIAFLYKILNEIKKEQKYINILLTLIFGTSTCIWFFCFSYDMYILTNFYLSFIIYLIIKEANSNNSNTKRILLISLLSALSFGVTITNIITILILITALFIIKKDKKIIITYFISLLAFISIFQLIQMGVEFDSIRNLFYTKTGEEFNQWINLNFFKNIINFINSTLVMPTSFNSTGYLIILFYISLYITGIKNSISKNILREDKITFYTITTALCFNLICTFFWCSQSGFLFTLNHYILWFIILKYSLFFTQTNKKEKQTKNKNIILYLIMSTIIFVQIYSFAIKKIDYEKIVFVRNYIEKIDFKDVN